MTEDQGQSIDELTQQLLKLREENSRMGQINQELAEKLKNETDYNKALGIDLYNLDQQISDVEGKYKANMAKAKELHLKTKEMKRRTNDYKSYLGMNSEAADMAKKLQLLQEFRDQATLGLNELEKILSDENLSKLPYSTQSLEEKIHFLFWYNHDLERSIRKLSAKLPPSQVQQHIDKDCGTSEQISHTKEEWEKMKLYQSISETNSEAAPEGS